MSNLKLKVLSRIMDSGLVAVVRADSSDQASRIAEACANGGVAAVEITFTVPGTAGVISDLAKQYKNDEILIGAGTVLDPETARIAILSGAQFVVEPGAESGHGAALQSISDSVHARRSDRARSDRSHGMRRGHRKSVSWRNSGAIVCESDSRASATGITDADWRRGYRQCCANGSRRDALQSVLEETSPPAQRRETFKTITTLAKQFIEKIRSARA